ncbi:dihydrofolate reductase [soil metagenome]
MSEPRLHAIVALASNRVIGRGGRLPWRFPEDLRWFKKITLGHPIVMGRKTWESLPRSLPGRRNIVLTRSGDAPAIREAGAEVAPSVEAVDPPLPTGSPTFVIGGAEIYRLLIPRCQEVIATHIFAPYEGDTYLPPFEHAFRVAETLTRTEDFEIRRYVRL